MLERYGMLDAHPIFTPVLPNQHLTKLSSPEVDVKTYQCAMGALMYPMLATCPDIAYTIAALSQHAANPSSEHQHALDHVFHYLHATADHQLVYKQGAPGGETLFGLVDADWASDVNYCKSTSGFLCMLAGGTISWSSKKQGFIALSSTEAEYIAAAHAAKEIVWLRQLISELHQSLPLPTVLHINNQSAIAITKNPEFHDCYTWTLRKWYACSLYGYCHRQVSGAT